MVEGGRDECWGGLGAESTGQQAAWFEGVAERKELGVLPSSRWKWLGRLSETRAH